MPAKQRESNLLRSRYVLLFLGLVIVWWVGFYFVDIIFYDRAALQFPDPNQLASSLGILFAASGVLGLIITTFFTGPVLNRYGLRVGLIVLPVMLTASIGGLAVGRALGLAVTALFILAALAKITNLAFGFTLDLAAHTLLYQPLPAERRASVQTLADGIVQPLAIGLAGFLLLIFNTILGFRAIQLSFLFLIIAAVWITLVIALRREYPAALAGALAKRRLSASTAAFVDMAYFKALHQSLTSPHPTVVIYGLNLLEQCDPGSLAPILPRLLAHPSPEVRRVALESIERMNLEDALPAVRQSISEEPVSWVRCVAIQTLATLGGAETIEDIAPYLENPDVDLRLSALVGLLRSAGIEGTLYAGQVLLRMIQSPIATERELAAKALGEIGIRNYYQPLVDLLCDEDLAVRRAALYAAGQIRHARLWSIVVEALCSPRTHGVAVAALASGGEDALPEIQAALELGDANNIQRMMLAKVCGRIGGNAVTALLVNKVDDPDPDVGQDGATNILQAALAEELSQIRERIILLLSFILDTSMILQAHDSLNHGTVEQRAYAFEVLEVMLPDELKRPVLALLADLTLEGRFQQVKPFYPQERLSCEARLAGLIDGMGAGGTAWIGACARHVQHALSFSADGDTTMFSLIEKVITLKTTGIFAEIPDRTLAELAGLCEEVQVSADETIFQKGEIGKSLFVIASGRVRVHDGDQTLEYLTDGQVFGEMALLDPEPRSASITATEHTQLLRLDQEPFYELLEDQSEVARGMIKMLTRRLRARMQDLNELRSHVGGETAA
jgi:HEAT repeat protein